MMSSRFAESRFAEFPFTESYFAESRFAESYISQNPVSQNPVSKNFVSQKNRFCDILQLLFMYYSIHYRDDLKSGHCSKAANPRNGKLCGFVQFRPH